jgi:uncharacterized protein (UPF0548 family)
MAGALFRDRHLPSASTDVTRSEERQTDGVKLADLVRLDFNYGCIGCTKAAEVPPGYHRLLVRRQIGRGPEVFQRGVEALMTFKVQRATGLRTESSTPWAEVGTLILSRLAVLPAPCKVVRTISEPDQIGFAYGTLQGHPEAGEELFSITLAPDSAVWFTVLAYSYGATWYTRAAGPLTRLAQTAAAHAYTRSLRRLATP